jgi:hypothetical protein
VTRADALRSVVARTAADHPEGMITIEVGCGDGEHAGLFPAEGYLGLDDDADALATAASRHPDHRHAAAGTPLEASVAQGSAHLVVAFDALAPRTREERRAFLATAWHVLAVGGRLVLGEDVVSRADPAASPPRLALSVGTIMEDLIAATHRAVAIDDVAVVRSDEDALPDEVVLTLLRLGPR